MQDENRIHGFLSTPSARRATGAAPHGEQSGRNFYPRPPRGGRRPATSASPCSSKNFYPRPPRGGRPAAVAKALETQQFLSTPSARRATVEGDGLGLAETFLSTPSARRATVYITESGTAATDFYPRPPRGGRPGLGGLCRCGFPISIHALREEGDTMQNFTLTWPSNFYPRPPRGGRRASRASG